MNKEEFLRELEKHLTILEDGEQKDILEEYAQHIDMKISKGLSEEEAIQDFGSVKELTAHILEAYHVKPEFQKTTQEKKLPDFTKAAEETRKMAVLLKAIGDFFKTCWKKGKAAMSHFIHILGIPFCKLTQLIQKNKEKRNMEMGEEKKQKAKEEKTAVHSIHIGKAFTCIGNFCTGCVGLLFSLCKWCLRWFWNATVFSLTFFTGIIVLFFLFLFAVLLVWVLQGYPILGITIWCLGFVLSCGAFTFLLTTLLILKQKEKKNEQSIEESASEEVFHA